MSVYSLFGLSVDCDIALGNALSTGSDTSDITVRADLVAPVAAASIDGELLSEIYDGDGRLIASTGRVSADTVILRLPGTAEFRIDTAAGTMRYDRDPDATQELLSVFVTGMCLATYLRVTGRHILHASAVFVPELDGVVAFVGQSGSGKSTMATVMGAAGYGLVADDILRLERRDDEFDCYRGAVATRLRPKAADLAAGFAGVSTTGDQRLSVPLPVATVQLPALRAVVLPGPDLAAHQVSLTRLTGARALFALLACPRLLNWTEPARDIDDLDFLGALVDRVPIFASMLPWGPPFRPELAGELVSGLLDGTS